jgi:hypothetical protein
VNGVAGSLDQLQANLALLLLAVSVVALPLALARAARFWTAPADRASALVGAAVMAGAALRLLVAPLAIATVFIGYHATQQAIDLFPVSRYGVGGPALYNLLFGLVPPDHLGLMRANSVMGVLTLPLLATFGARVLGDRRAGALFALAVALVPQFVRNDNSDANNVPALLFLMGAAVLFADHLAAGEGRTLVGTVVLGAFAAMTRPEMPLLVIAVLATVALTRADAAHLAAERPAGWAPPFAGARPAALIAAGIALVLLVGPHLRHVWRSSDDLKASLTWGRDMKLATLPGKLVEMNAALQPRIYPRALLLLGLAGVALAPRARRRARGILAALALLSFGVYVVDVDWANVARVHVPGALWTTLLASAAAVDLLGAVRRRWPARPALSWLAGAALAGAVGLTAVPTARTLFAPTNEQAEDDFIRAAAAALPPGEITLLRLEWADRDPADPMSAFTHRFFPDYLFTPPTRAGHVLGLAAFRAHPDFQRPVFFYAGVRCFAQFRTRDRPPPHGDNHQAACQRMAEDFRLEEVLRRDVPNRGDVWLDYYGDAPTLPLALYRVRPREP